MLNSGSNERDLQSQLDKAHAIITNFFRGNLMSKFLRVLPQYLVPQHLLTRIYGWLAEIRCPRIKNWMIRTFIRRYQVDMSLAELEAPDDYPTFNSFFTRKLKPTLRPLAQGPNEIVSPVDGVISQLGHINKDTLLQAKGFDYKLTQLVGGNLDTANLFLQGEFATIYLSPKHYHRIHMPVTGNLRETIYIPGTLFSVNQLTASCVPHLFSRNERLVCLFDTEIGPMAVILVGAMIVGNIQTVWGENPKTNTICSKKHSGITLNRGDELGLFKLGSTVIVLFGENKMKWESNLCANSEVMMGQLLGQAVVGLQH